MIVIMLVGRFVNIFLCSKLANFARTDNLIDNKKGFFLWFSGVRGAMAFALAIKSKIDLPEAGPIFLVLTLIIISFTLLYSNLVLEFTLRKCEVINGCQADNFDESVFKQKSGFETFKNKIEKFNNLYLMPCVNRENKEEIEMSRQIDEVKIEESENKLDEIKINQINQIKDGENFNSSSHGISNSKDSKTFYEKRSSNDRDVTIDHKNFQIKNIHLFE